MNPILEKAGEFFKGSFIDGVRGWVATAMLAPVTAAGYFAWTTPMMGGMSGQDRYLEATRPLPAPSEESDYVVLVAEFGGDGEALQSRRIGEELIEQFGADSANSVFKVVYFPRVLRLSESADAVEAREDAERKGRQWLERQKADILVWGQVRKDNGELDLRLLRAGDAARATLPLSDLNFPQALGDQVGGAVAAVIAADAAPAYADGQFSADVLGPLVEKLRPLAMGSKLKGPSRGLLLASYADASAQLGAQTGRRAPLEEAVQAYRRALQAFDRTEQPTAWANAQANLGAALLTLGRDEPGGQRLEESAAAFQAALEVRTRENAPVEWAAAQSNLGAALAALGEREAGSARLIEAISAYEEALSELNRDRAPGEWAQTKNNLGAALTALGDREGDASRYREAVNAFEDALKERTRDRAPLEWAATQNNLGIALAAWGQKDKNAGRIEDAVKAYRAALEERTQQRNALEWGATQANLATALRMTGEQKKDPQRLAEAADAYRAALGAVPRDRAPMDWAIAQNGLGNAEESLGDITRDPMRYVAAREAFAAALSGFQQVGAAGPAEVAQRNLARVTRKAR